MTELLANNLRKLRQAKGLTISDLEKLSGVDKSIISRLENGQRGVSMLTAIKLARALKVDLAELFPKARTGRRRAR